MSHDIKLLLKNPSYLCLTGSFILLYGIFNAFGSVVSSLTAPYGYTSVHNSIFGAVFIVSGILGSFVYGVLLDKYQKYKLIFLIITMCTCITIGLALATLPSGNAVLFAINLIVLGSSILSAIPVSYAFSVELTYPISEAMSNGMMIMCAQIFGSALVSIHKILTLK